VAYKSAGRLQDAEREFLAATQLKPGFAAPHFQLYNLLRQADRKDEAKKELQLFLAAKKAQEGALGQEDAEWCDYAEIYDPLEGTRRPTSVPQKYSPRRLNVKADAATAGVAVLDLMGNGGSDAVVWSAQGIVVLAHGSEELKNTGLEDVRDVVAEERNLSPSIAQALDTPMAPAKTWRIRRATPFLAKPSQLPKRSLPNQIRPPKTAPNRIAKSNARISRAISSMAHRTIPTRPPRIRIMTANLRLWQRPRRVV